MLACRSLIWPTSFGSLYKIPHLVGGVKFEHIHRMIAQFVDFSALSSQFGLGAPTLAAG